MNRTEHLRRRPARPSAGAVPVTEPLLQVQYRLTDRDLRLLGWLADHDVLTTDQIAHALFPSRDFAQRRLLTLHRMHVVGRFRPQRPEGGTHPYHYVLAQLGVDIVAAQRGQDPRVVATGQTDDDRLPRRDQAKRRRWWLTNRARLPHLLAVNQFFTDLAGYARTHPDHQLDLWWPTSRCMTTAAFARGIYYTQSHGAWYATIRADGHGIWTRHATDPQTGDHVVTRVPFFAEIDLSTEDLGRLVDKNTAYDSFAQRSGFIWPVLYWLQSPARERHFHARLSEHRFQVPIATATVAHATAAGLSPADPVWRLHHRPGTADGDDEPARRFALIDFAANVAGRPTPSHEKNPA